MPDISMCLGKGCNIKDSCYRFTAIPDKHWQSYSDFKPSKDGKKCEDYWKIKIVKENKNK